MLISKPLSLEYVRTVLFYRGFNLPLIVAMIEKIQIDRDIRKAKTLPASFYRSEKVFESLKSAVFEQSWQFCGAKNDLLPGPAYFPFEFMPEYIPEPLLISKDKQDHIHCLSNVCTHRGNLLAYEPGKGSMLSCRYHGRCFRLDGRFKSMPGFETVEDFPTQQDNLSKVPFGEWLGLFFASLNPVKKFSDWLAPVSERLSWLDLKALNAVPEVDQHFDIAANWMLYCDNFLEGFHIPFVHPALNNAIGTEPYEVELFDSGSLQIGLAKAGEPCFTPPEGHQNFGKRVYAYYFWLFPNLMLNFYPWGLSLNQVLPLDSSHCRIKYRTFMFEGTTYDRAVNAIEQTELEDQMVVEATQKGIQSRFYDRGRYAPEHEQAVHHFHQMLLAAMKG